MVTHAAVTATTSFTTATSTISSGANSLIPIPLAPSNLVVDGSPMANYIKIVWRDNSSNEYYFEVGRRLATTSVADNAIWKVNQNRTTFTDTSVTPQATYNYRVRACTSTLICSDYVWLYAVTIPPKISSEGSGNLDSFPSGLPPAAPTDVTATYNACGTPPLLLTWHAATGALEYKIYRGGTSLYSTTGLSYSGTALSSSSPNPYLVYAYNPYGTSTGAYVTHTSSVQCAPTNTTVLSYSSTTTLVNSTSTAQHYTTPVDSTVQQVIHATTTDPTIITSTSSIPIVVKVLVPTAPSQFSLYSAPTPRTVSLRWINSANKKDKNNIERKISTSDSYSVLQQVGPFTNSYIDYAIYPGVSYDYRIQSCLSGVGCSDYTYLTNVFVPNLGVLTVRMTAEASSTIINQLHSASSTVERSLLISSTPASTTTLSAVAPRIIPHTQVSTTTTKFSIQAQNIGLAVEQIKGVVNDTKVQLSKITNDHVDRIINEKQAIGQSVDTIKINRVREEVLQKINSSLQDLTTITPKDVNKLREETEAGIAEIKLIAGEKQIQNDNQEQIVSTINALTTVINSRSVDLKKEGADLLYKDSNKDGISDYDSIHVYQIDPVKPSPVSTYKGRVINAADKILLGFDPKNEELVKVTVEEPLSSSAPVVSTLRVSQIELTTSKEVVIKGQALPNSFVTIYIYSTPIIVTVKTNSQGEWQYTLDKELESGDHTIYTATVNNAGNIIARSPGFQFARTAEAMTLNSEPVLLATDTSRPGLLGDTFWNLTIAVMAGIIILGLMLILAGRGKRIE